MVENFLHQSKKAKLSRKKVIIISIAVVMIAVFAAIYFFLYLPASALKVKGATLMTSAKKVIVAFKSNDMDEVGKQLKELDESYASFKITAQKIYWLRYAPFASPYGSDLKNAVKAGEEVIKSLIITERAVAPYADLIGFKKGSAGFLEQSADDRIQTAVLTLDKVIVKADDIADHIEKARENISQIDENRYPKKIGKREIRGKIKGVKEQFETFASLFVDAKPFFKKLPEILGAEKEKKYLVLFQNDKELRPTGGFLTAYAFFKVNKGKLKIERSEDIYSLDASIPSHPKAPPEILTYHKAVFTFNIRDSNLSPDLPESIKLFNSLYEKSRQKIKYEGVIMVDTQVLVDALTVLGDTEADGVLFSSKSDKRCDCPQVIYKLFDMIDRPVSYVKENRKGVLGDLLFTLMQKALSSSPKQYWGKLSQDILKNLQEKHILLYFQDSSTQNAVEKINFGGRVREYKGDYLHINDTNFAGAKSNLFVSHTIISTTEIKSDGEVERTLQIEYKNPYPHSDCDLERGGLCLNATLRNWVRIYVPSGSKLVNFQGSEKKTKVYQDLGKTVFEGFTNVPPKGKTTLIVKYKLPFKVDNEKDYTLLIQKQPGTFGHLYDIIINGRQRDNFKLIKDKEFKLK